MIISDVGLNLIKKYEGCHLTAYKCPSGVWTIGYGHTKNVVQGQMISQAEAEIILREDVKNAEKYVQQYMLIYGFNQNQFDALTSFTYNCGAGNLKKLVNGGHRTIHEISEAIPNYNKSKGKVLNGLVKRRAEEKALFDKGIVKKSNHTVALDVIAGVYGNGREREIALLKEGYSPKDIQAEVNRIIKSESARDN